MTALVLDTRALEVVADPKADISAARRMRDMLASAARTRIPVRVPTAALAEAYRGVPADAAFDRVLARGIRLFTTGQAAARLRAPSGIAIGWTHVIPSTLSSSRPRFASAAASSRPVIPTTCDLWLVSMPTSTCSLFPDAGPPPLVRLEGRGVRVTAGR